ncbi:MAG: hypothetical protein WC759_03045 [Candidatus Micrarchaeia archaeon]
MNFRNSALFAVAIFALLFGCAGAPNAPLEAKATPNSGGILVSWSPSSSTDVSGYNVYRSNAVGQLGGKINGNIVNDVSFQDSNVQNNNLYYYTVRSVSSNGAESQNTNQVAATAQTAPPSGLSLSINGGSQYATSTDVTLSITATGAAACHFSNDGTTWGPWQPYAQQATWQLSAGDGQKTVYMECRNSAGVVSAGVSSTVQLRTTGPSIAIAAPQQGDTVPTRFTLSFSVTNTIGQATCHATADGATVPIGDVAEGDANTVSIILQDGGHELTVTCADDAGSATSQAISFETEQNAVKLTINDGSSPTASTTVTLHLFAPATSQCRFSNDGTVWNAWANFAPTQSWTLTSGDGKKTVYAECQNRDNVPAGNASDTIELDTEPAPYVSLVINNGELVTYSRTVKLNIYASTSVTQCHLSTNAGATYSAWAPYVPSQWYTLQGSDGTKYLTVECENAAGTKNSASASITLQTSASMPPTSLYIDINGGASSTTSPNVQLSLSARFADNCRLRNEDGAWGDWEPYMTGRAWSLSSGQGSKMVFYQCNNQYGTSGVAQAGITYGSGRPPMVTLVTPVDGQSYSDSSVQIQFIPDGGISPFSCTYYCNGVQNNAGSVAAGTKFSRTLIYEGMQFGDTCGVPEAGSRITTYAICTDNSGQGAQTSQATFTWTKWVGPLLGGST